MKNHYFRHGAARERGVTLIELLIVVAIVALITSIAYPSYTRYIVKAKRTVAQSALMQVADRQQQFFMDNKRYAANMTALGFPADPWVVDDDGKSTVGGDVDAIYSVSLANVTATTYTANAAPINQQLSRDTYCGTLNLNQSGLKDKTGAFDDCW